MTDQAPQSGPKSLTIAEALKRGVACHKAGQLAEAERLYRAILQAHPKHPDANHNLGVLAVGMGKPDAGLPFLKAALEANPNQTQYWLSYVDGLIATGDLESAREAVNSAEKRGFSRHLFQDTTQSSGAAARPTGPTQAEGERLVALFNQGLFTEAEELGRALTRQFPNDGFGWKALGAVLHRCGRYEEALGPAQRAASLLPNVAEAHSNLALVFKGLGRMEEAEASCRHAIALEPGYASAHTNLGTILLARRRLEEAEASFRRALVLDPNDADAHNNLGATLIAFGRPIEADISVKRAIELNPRHAEAHNNLFLTSIALGRLEEGMASSRRALAVKPNYAEAHSNLLLLLNYLPQVTPAESYAEHRRWEEQQTIPGRVVGPRVVDTDPGRRLRVGYVSPDLMEHSVANFFEPLLREHDRAEFEVFCYAEVVQPDAVTTHLQGLADRWRRTVGLSDQALARHIADDGIDILVDLAGHTSRSRLSVFALKPAPIQVTWLGYPNTTGLRAVDYRLVDETTDPTGVADAFAVEHLVRLKNGFLCYGAPATAPQPSVPPSTLTGKITFGSFNNALKLSSPTLDAWATLLRRVPDSRLLLKASIFHETSTRTAFLSRLQQRRIDTARVTLCERTAALENHLADYGQMDIALDPFPYNGTTTTCEAMWMGVPVVTLRGEAHAGRVGASLLTRVGLTELIAGSVETYVEIAASLARDPRRLTDFRHTLRERVAKSPLCDAPAFARQIEAAFRKMWRSYCDGADATT